MTVYANGLEVSCKAQGNKVIAAFPDVCFTPPQTPATPPGVPIPYPTFGFDSDADKGTGTVKIGGKTITQKNVSYYTKTTGTEAGCAPKKGIVTSKNTGKEYAAAWSSDVKADGQPVARMSDFATVNHSSPMGNAAGGKVGKTGGGGQPVDCDALADEIEELICRNKHDTAGQGTHGYLFRMAEQICGEHGPGTAGWTGHETALKESHRALKKAVTKFMANCDLDDYVFGERRERERDERVKDVINRVHNNDPSVSPTGLRHLGRSNPLCQDLDGVRADRSLGRVFEVIGL